MSYPPKAGAVDSKKGNASRPSILGCVPNRPAAAGRTGEGLGIVSHDFPDGQRGRRMDGPSGGWSGRFQSCRKTDLTRYFDKVWLQNLIKTVFIGFNPAYRPLSPGTPAICRPGSSSL